MNFSDERSAGDGGGIEISDVNPCLPPIERSGNDKYQRGQPKKEENPAGIFENGFTNLSIFISKKAENKSPPFLSQVLFQREVDTRHQPAIARFVHDQLNRVSIAA